MRKASSPRRLFRDAECPRQPYTASDLHSSSFRFDAPQPRPSRRGERKETGAMSTEETVPRLGEPIGYGLTPEPLAERVADALSQAETTITAAAEACQCARATVAESRSRRASIAASLAHRSPAVVP